MVMFFAQGRECSLILDPVSLGFVFCRQKSGTRALCYQHTKIFNCCSTSLFLKEKSWGQRQSKPKNPNRNNIKDKQVYQAKEKKKNNMNACMCSQCCREALNTEKSKPKAVLIGLQNL